MASELVEPETRSLYRQLLTNASDEVHINSPPPQAIRDLISVLRDMNTLPRVHLLAPEDRLKSVMDDFLVASAAADLTATNDLEIRTNTAQPKEFLMLAEDASMIVGGDSQAAAIVTENEDFVDFVSMRCTSAWQNGEDFSLRIPAISRIRDSLDRDLSPEIKADFDAVLRSLETARGDDSSLDAVTVSLLVAAKNEALLYDLSKWGEDIGLCSRTTFSRIKTNLEEQGILDTEKVPTEVGRPRQRLKLGDKRLQRAKASELASVVRNTLP